MLQSHGDLKGASGFVPTIPDYRFRKLESPLDTAAKSAGYNCWNALVSAIEQGQQVEVLAPEICGSCGYLVGDFIQAAFADFKVDVLGTRQNPAGDVFLLLCGKTAA